MIKKLKYIFLLILSSSVFAFITLLIGKNYINILATTIDNTLGSYPVQLDYDNYNRDNLLSLPNENLNISNCGVNLTYNKNTYTFNVIGEVVNECNFIIFDKFDITLDSGTYTFAMVDYENNKNLRLLLFLGNGVWGTEFTINNYGNEPEYNTVTFDNKITLNTLRFWTQNGLGELDYSFKLMLYKGVYDIDKKYSSDLKFGYNVDLAINYTPAGFHNFNTIIKFNNNICFNKTISTLNDTTYFRIKNACFIPFDLNSSGYFSLKDTSLSVELSAGSGVSSIDYQSGFILTPTLKGYYKGEYVEDIIYLKNNYLSNAFFYNGFNARVENNPITEELAKPSLFITENNKSLALYRLNDTNQTFNLIGEQIEDVSFVNSINLKNDMNFTIGFDFGENTSFSSINKLKYVFSFSGINSIVLGDVGSTSPLPDNVTTFDKYNRCSAWYDIPCQLGNGLTYLIYEAPIVSPVLTFVVSFVTMFSSLVSFVELFKSFGIVFGCFIIYMFIELLHKYSK